MFTRLKPEISRLKLYFKSNQFVIKRVMFAGKQDKMKLNVLNMSMDILSIVAYLDNIGLLLIQKSICSKFISLN